MKNVILSTFFISLSSEQALAHPDEKMPLKYVAYDSNSTLMKFSPSRDVVFDHHSDTIEQQTPTVALLVTAVRPVNLRIRTIDGTDPYIVRVVLTPAAATREPLSSCGRFDE